MEVATLNKSGPHTKEAKWKWAIRICYTVNSKK